MVISLTCENSKGHSCKYSFRKKQGSNVLEIVKCCRRKTEQNFKSIQHLNMTALKVGFRIGQISVTNLGQILTLKAIAKRHKYM